MTTSGRRECHDVLVRISAYLDGELDAPACDAIEQHCQHCPSCAALVAGLRNTIGLCRSAGSVPLPESVRQRARESVRRLLENEFTDRSSASRR
jgi:anti-sigma factor RsiW